VQTLARSSARSGDQRTVRAEPAHRRLQRPLSVSSRPMRCGPGGRWCGR
jgi:hypothetical protein